VPKEVLVSEMVEHQKYFPVAKKDGTLSNHFIISANVPPTDSIRYGNRKVLSSRLADGVFLFEQDLKHPLESFNETLKTIMFQKGLGSLHDKIDRLASHVKIVQSYLPKANLQFALEAATLCKADLASEMVGEFPELQGQMGRIYASLQGKPQEVALAIDEHWMPRGEKAALPATDVGALLSICDKIDNLLGFFGLNLKPTSSSDPYALRRQALGLVRIIFDKQISVSLSEILKEALESLPAEIRNQGDTLVSEVLNYCIARARGILQEAGYPKDEIEACLAIRSDNLYDVRCRLEALHAFRKESKNFGQVIEVHKRCQGQINGYSRQTVSSSLFSETAEKTLYNSIQTSRAPYLHAIENRQYTVALGLLANLQPQLAELFDKVKILDGVEQIRNNRLALLQEVSELFAELADFQKIQ
jgi:glycyl-tRNA synthetase